MSWTRWRRSAIAGVVVAVSLVGCTSEDDAPVEAADSAGASPSESPTPTTEATTPAPAESTSGTPAAVDETPSPAPSAPSAPAGCDPGVFTPTVRVDVGRSVTQLLGFGVRSVAPGGSVRSPGYSVELFEALFSGVVDQDGAELTGRLRTAVVERLGADVVRDGLDEVRVPLRLRNTSGQNRDYVVYAFATRSEGSWTATHCPEGVEEPEPTETKGTFATWQRLDHGVVACGTDPATVSRVAGDALLNGCG